MDLKIADMIMVLIWLFASAAAESGQVNALTLQHIANVSYADERPNLHDLASIFSPRMDFDQWKPLTGRGDPLRNDPTYDYEPPVLERVHYWADDTRLEREHYPEREHYSEQEHYPEREHYPGREHYPERKSEVLMLGVSSRKPSVTPRHPPTRRHRPHPTKYEDYSYKLSDHYPMTILVPPPPPPRGHTPSLFTLEDTLPSSNRITDPPKLQDTTPAPNRQTSSYALQEANLIFQASTTNHDWVFEYNQTKDSENSAVSSDYAGWGPTTPLDDENVANDTHNIIPHGRFQFSKHPYSFYKPMLSEAPPPPRVTQNPLLLPTFIPTSLPPLSSAGSAFSTSTKSHFTRPTSTKSQLTQPTWPTEVIDTETPTDTHDYNDETTTTEKYVSTIYYTTPMFSSTSTKTTKRPPPVEKSLFDMLNPMMSMPLNAPERVEDNLYAHASENLHIFKETPEATTKLETMQTMQPPPLVVKTTESASTTHKQPQHVHKHNFLHKKPSLHTHDPYLHMRFTTPMPTAAVQLHYHDNTRFTTEAPAVPMYLIIQGHSKVKTYGSKPKPIDETDTISNEITKPNETYEVKHLHTIKEKSSKPEKSDNIRRSRAQNLRTLVEEGHGSIEIQEANLGIKYDVSDGSDVPVEIYRKGIVDNYENNYGKSNTVPQHKRTKRQLDWEDLSDLLPDEKTMDGIVYSFLKDKRNSTGLTGIVAKVVAGDDGGVIDDLDDDDDDDDDDDSSEYSNRDDDDDDDEDR